jgi:hypothetical protein
MWDQPVVRDLVFLAIAALVGGVVAFVSVPKSASRRPVWAVRVYLAIFQFFPGLRAAANREWFSRREQLLATFFLVSFVVFVVAAVGFGCSYRLGCK